MINNRFLDIVRLLLKQDDYITINEISKNLNVSNKTIRNDLVQVGDWLKENNLNLIKKTGVGVMIEGDKTAKLNIYNQVQEKNKKNIDYSPQARKIYIGMKLILNEKSHIFELAEELYVSRATIHKDILSLMPVFESYKIKVNRKNNNGLFIEGSEKNIRKILFDLMLQDNGYSIFSQMIKNTNFACDGSFPFAALDVNDDELKEFLQVLEIVNNKQLHSLLLSSLIHIILHILISYVRMNQNNYIHLSDEFKNELANQPYYDDAKDLLLAITNHYDLNLSEDEIRYLQIFLISTQNSGQHEVENKEEALELTKKLLREWDKALPGYNFLNDHILYTVIFQHTCPSISRFKHGIMINNPLMNDIEVMYKNTFEVVKQSMHVIENKYNCKVSDDEAGFYTLHLAAALDRFKKPLRTLLCSHGNLGATNLLVQKLNTQFPELEIIETVNFVTIHDAKLENIDLILSTIDLDFEVLCPLVRINIFLYDHDITRLKNVISSYYKDKNNPLNNSKKAV